MKKLKISRFIHKFEKGNYAVLFRSLTLNKAYGKKDFINQLFNFFQSPISYGEAIQKLPKDIIDNLVTNKIVVEDNLVDESNLHYFQGYAGKSTIRNIVMLVSNNCNFRCSYCQIEENMRTDHMINMSESVADKALNVFKKNSLSSKHKTVTITGGEPLMNIKVVKYIIEKVKKDLENTRIVIFTNGSLIDKELAEYFKENNVLLLVSIDGPEEMHDKVRTLKNGKGTFHKVIENYKMLESTGCQVGISAVGGLHNIDMFDKTIHFFTSLTPQSIGFNFSHLLIDKKNPTEISFELFGDLLIKFYKILREKNIFLENISRPISAFVSDSPKIQECQAQGYGFTVDARGKIGPCKSLVVSDVFSEYIETVENIKENSLFMNWSIRSPLFENDCLSCAALGICGGGCAYDSYIANNGNFKAPDKRICVYEKKVLDFLLWDLFDKIKSKVDNNTLYIPPTKEQEFIFNQYYDPTKELQRSVGHEKE